MCANSIDAWIKRSQKLHCCWQDENLTKSPEQELFQHVKLARNAGCNVKMCDYIHTSSHSGTEEFSPEIHSNNVIKSLNMFVDSINENIKLEKVELGGTTSHFVKGR